MVIMEQTLVSLITVEQTANAKLLHRTIARVWYAGQFDPLSWSQSILQVLWCGWLGFLSNVHPLVLDPLLPPAVQVHPPR